MIRMHLLDFIWITSILACIIGAVICMVKHANGGSDKWLNAVGILLASAVIMALVGFFTHITIIT